MGFFHTIRPAVGFFRVSEDVRPDSVGEKWLSVLVRNQDENFFVVDNERMFDSLFLGTKTFFMRKIKEVFILEQNQYFGGDWTTEKLERVKKYLQAYVRIMNKQTLDSFISMLLQGQDMLN